MIIHTTIDHLHNRSVGNERLWMSQYLQLTPPTLLIRMLRVSSLRRNGIDVMGAVISWSVGTIPREHTCRICRPSEQAATPRTEPFSAED